jgi:HKD family nuclease
MPTFSIIAPLDQPLGKRRLLDDLKRLLSDDNFTEFGMSVAFAKVGPLYRLQESLVKWRSSGRTATAIFGIDHRGTSKQALEFALEHLDQAYYTQYKGHSFHPKIYWFKGKKKAVAFIGSNNMTMGGMELNFEAAVELGFKLPEEAAEFDEAHLTFTGLLPAECIATRPLTKEALIKLDAEGLLLDETKKAAKSGGLSGGSFKVAHPPGEGERLPVKPASSLPPGLLKKSKPKKEELAKKADLLKAQAEKIDVMKPLVPVGGLAIQINPHANGEIFLSTLAVKQNPAFFGMPFTGQTKPKSTTKNPGYPQRDPDPICDITVYGKKNKVVHHLSAYALNTVLYTRNSEIRVTASPLVPHVPDGSILVMMPSDLDGIDYGMDVYRPDSPDYQDWLTVCDQTMPSGGKANPRRFGWF